MAYSQGSLWKHFLSLSTRTLPTTKEKLEWFYKLFIILTLHHLRRISIKITRNTRTNNIADDKMAYN